MDATSFVGEVEGLNFWLDESKLSVLTEGTATLGNGDKEPCDKSTLMKLSNGRGKRVQEKVARRQKKLTPVVIHLLLTMEALAVKKCISLLDSECLECFGFQ